LIGERTVRVSHALPRDAHALPRDQSSASGAQWSYPQPSYAPSAYYPQYSYYAESYYAPYYEPYYAPSAVPRDNGDNGDAVPSPDVASEARAWQPFSVAHDNEQYVATQLHVLGRYHVRPRV
jgi:hypothetical protein